MTTDALAGSQYVVRRVGEGDAVWSMGSRWTLKLRAAETGGALSLQEVLAPVGSAPPLHTHTRESEVFVLLEGEMVYRAGDHTFEAGAGSTIYLPQGMPHAFRVVGAVPARFLAMTFPGGLENLYEEIGRPATAPGLPDPPTAEEVVAWLQASANYGLEVNGPPLPEVPV